MPTAPSGSSGLPNRSMSLQTHVRMHVQNTEDGNQLITVRHQPQGPVAYLFEPDDELVIEAVDIVGGNIITQAVHERWGRVFVIPSGPSVTEVCLHETYEQRDTYRQRCRELEADYIRVLTTIGDLEPMEPQDPDGDGP